MRPYPSSLSASLISPQMAKVAAPSPRDEDMFGWSGTKAKDNAINKKEKPLADGDGECDTGPLRPPPPESDEMPGNGGGDEKEEKSDNKFTFDKLKRRRLVFDTFVGLPRCQCYFVGLRWPRRGGWRRALLKNGRMYYILCTVVCVVLGTINMHKVPTITVLL